jgi:hypothetical protein
MTFIRAYLKVQFPVNMLIQMALKNIKWLIGLSCSDLLVFYCENRVKPRKTLRAKYYAPKSCITKICDPVMNKIVDRDAIFSFT